MDQSELTVKSSVFVTARYDLQHKMEFFVLIGIPLGVLIAIPAFGFSEREGQLDADSYVVFA
jgi:hypothetical protein